MAGLTSRNFKPRRPQHHKLNLLRRKIRGVAHATMLKDKTTVPQALELQRSFNKVISCLVRHDRRNLFQKSFSIPGYGTKITSSNLSPKCRNSALSICGVHQCVRKRAWLLSRSRNISGKTTPALVQTAHPWAESDVPGLTCRLSIPPFLHCVHLQNLCRRVARNHLYGTTSASALVRCVGGFRKVSKYRVQTTKSQLAVLMTSGCLAQH